MPRKHRAEHYIAPLQRGYGIISVITSSRTKVLEKCISALLLLQSSLKLLARMKRDLLRDGFHLLTLSAPMGTPDMMMKPLKSQGYLDTNRSRPFAR